MTKVEEYRKNILDNTDNETIKKLYTNMSNEDIDSIMKTEIKNAWYHLESDATTVTERNSITGKVRNRKHYKGK